MCTNGVNTSQLKDTITQIDETIALTRRWTHRMYHMAENAQFERSQKELGEVQQMLDDVRAKLDELGDIIDKDDQELGSASVNLVQNIDRSTPCTHET